MLHRPKAATPRQADQNSASHASPKTATENRQRLRRAAEDYGWHMANAADVELQVH